MHILFVSGEYPPMRGGVGAYTAELGRALKTQGVDVSVITRAMVESGDNSPGYPQIYPQIHQWGWGMVGEIARLAQAIKADWLHVQYQTAAFAMHPAIHFAPIFWKRAGLRVAWTYHDLLAPYLFPKAGTKIRRWVTHYPAQTAHVAVVTNEGDYRQLQPHARRLAKIPIGSNVAGLTLSTEERRAQRQQRGYGPDDLVLGYFGFLNQSKGGMTLIDTLHRLVQSGRNARLLMIGERVGASDPTNQRYLHKVESQIVRLGLAERVQWTGHQSAAAVSADLNAVDVLLMPYTDGVSLRRGTLLAGLANGCAIVTTEPQAPLPELAHERDLLLVPPADAVATAAAVMRLMDTPALLAAMRQNARQCHQAFTWERIVEQHRAIYCLPEDHHFGAGVKIHTGDREHG